MVLLLVPVLAMAVPKKKMVFKATQSHKANEKIIKKGIEGAVEDMSFITRPIARKKLENSNTAFKTIDFDFKGDKIMITNDGRKPVVANADGSKTKWTREDGETFMVQHKLKDDEIEQVFHADEGVKTLRYVFNDDASKLTMHVRLDSPKLSGPLKYKLDYVRK